MASHGIRDRVAIVGMGCTPFGEHWDRSADDLMVQAVDETRSRWDRPSAPRGDGRRGVPVRGRSPGPVEGLMRMTPQQAQRPNG